MDHESVLLADGVPFEFEYERDGETVLGVPGNDEVFEAAAEADARSG